MTRIHHRLLLACPWALVLLLAACGGGGGGGEAGGGGGGGGGGGSNPPLSGNYYPLAEGDRWFSRAGTDVSSVRVTGTRATATGPAFVVRSEDADGVTEELVQRTADGVWSQAADTSDPVATALGRVQLLRLPLIVGDSYQLFDRTLTGVDDFDGDGRPDTLRIVARVTVLGVATAAAGGLSLANVARVRTEVTQTFSLSGRPQPVVGQTVVEELLAPEIGTVGSTTTTRIDGSVNSSSSETAFAWRVGGRPNETVAPTALQFTPANGSLLQNATLRITFSEAIDRDSAGPTALTLLDANGTAAAATLRWLSDRELELLPTAPLANGVWLPRIGATVQDLAGNLLTAQPAWQFTVDASGPRLLSQSPAPGSVNVPVNSAIRMVFDERLGDVFARAGLVSVLNGLAGELRGTLTLEGDRTLVYTVPGGLPQGQRLEVRLGAVPDALGNFFPGATWTFDVDPGRFDLAVALPAPVGLTNGRVVRFASSDSDGDGRAELLATSIAPEFNFTDALYRLRFGADGSLSTPQRLQTLATDCTTTGFVVADLDGDGLLDAVVSSEAGFAAACGLHVLRGTAGGGFAAPQALHLGNGGSVQVLRNAADGRPMIVMPLDDQRLLVLRQRLAAGVWDAPQYLSTATDAGGGTWNRAVAVGDVNGDGRTDLVVLVPQRSGLGLERQVFLQAADGSLSAAVRFDQRGAQTGATVALADINGDNRADLVLLLNFNLAWLPAGADGSFGAAQVLPDTLSSSEPVFADINGDGLADLVFTQHNVGLRVMLRDAAGTLRPAETLRGGVDMPNPGRLVVADFNGDGLADLAVNGTWLRQRAAATISAATSARRMAATTMAARSEPAAASAATPVAGGMRQRPARKGQRFGTLLEAADGGRFMGPGSPCACSAASPHPTPATPCADAGRRRTAAGWCTPAPGHR